MANDPGLRRTLKTMMSEAKAVAEQLGITFPVSMDERIEMTAGVGEHRTSVIELDRLTGVVMPMIELIFDLTRVHCRISAAQAH